jgi:K+-sensing histidine kinase KdpD
MPLLFGSKIEGAIVFIRFGGPPYLPDHIRLAKFITDLIALHLRNRQLVDQIAELEAKRRLDNLQKDFISMISHELLTPLGFIKGYTTTLLRNDTSWDNKIRQEFLTIINREADHLRNLIINLLDSSRLETGHLKLNYQPIWLYTNLREICLRVKSHHTQSRIILDQSNGDIQIYVDPVRFAQVIENILNNAIKYAPNSPIKISIKKKREIVCIIIGDKGPGISQDHIEKIFRRFYRIPGKIETSIQGVGLGLYISQKIIQAHGGDLFAKSSPQNGTTFHIQLPYGDLRLSESID